MARNLKKQGTMKTDGTTQAIPLAAILFLLLSLFSLPPAGWAAATEVLVFFSGNVFGELEPCGG